MVTVIDCEKDPAKRRRRLWGENLSALLETRGMTAKQFHAALVDAGLSVSQQAMYLWLKGKTAPRPEHQAVISRVLGVPAHMTFPTAVPG